MPLLQTGLWVALIVIAAWKYDLGKVIDALARRIERGSSFKAGPFEVGEDLKSLEHVAPSETRATTTNDWATQRNAIYQRSHGIFLAHVIEPSSAPGQLYDVFIFLVGHKSRTLDDVNSAEFFLGAYWGNKVFTEKLKNGAVGISTTAFGPFLCTCRVTLKDGTEFRLERYIDFEMGRVFR